LELCEAPVIVRTVASLRTGPPGVKEGRRQFAARLVGVRKGLQERRMLGDLVEGRFEMGHGALRVAQHRLGNTPDQVTLCCGGGRRAGICCRGRRALGERAGGPARGSDEKSPDDRCYEGDPSRTSPQPASVPHPTENREGHRGKKKKGWLNELFF
jgi:hypothetical protein